MFERIVNKQMKARYLIWFVVLGLVFGSFLGSVRGTVTTVTLENWDSYTAGTLLGSSSSCDWKVSSTVSGNGVYLGNYMVSSPKSLYVGRGSVSSSSFNSYLWMNLSSGYPYISDVHLAYMCNGAMSTGNVESHLYFYNGSDVVIDIKTFTTSAFGFDVGVYVRNLLGTYVLLAPGSHMYGNVYLNISHYMENIINVTYKQGSYRYYYNGTTYMNGTGGVNYYSFDRMYFKMVGNISSSSFEYRYFDDIRITSDSVYPGGGGIGVCDLSGYGSVCSGPSSGVYGGVYGAQYLEQQFNSLFTGSIIGVSLPISFEQYTTVSDNVSDYEMFINGVNCGHPVAIVPQGTNGYALQWCNLGSGFGIGLEDEYPLFSFSCSQYVQYVNRYYWFGVGMDETPDGSVFSKYHNGYSYYINNVLDGFTMPGGQYSMCYYYSTLTFTNETSPYSDLLTCPKTAYHTYENVPLYYQIADFTYGNTIQLWHNGTQMTAQGFPYTIPSGSFNGELSFVPLTIGSYQFRLMRNSISEASFNITVTDPSDTDFILYVIPNPCDNNVPVLIGYRYYPSDGEEGFIGVSEFRNSTNFDDFSQKWVIDANTSGNFTFLTSINAYVSMYKKTGSTYLLKQIVYLKVRSSFSNTINVAYLSISLPVGGSFTQRIYGTQNINGFVVSVRLNNQLISYVTDKMFYEVYKVITVGKLYRADLCIETANGTVVLASVNFTVSVSQGSQGEGGAFSPELKALFGICFVIVAVCVPLMISVKYHVNVPTFVYVIFMAFGIGLGVKLGFLDLWLVFLFVVALVAGAIYTIFGHGGPGPGSGTAPGSDRTIRERVFTRRNNDDGVKR